MKQFFLSAALLVSAALSFTACNNGTYDANPATNNSSTGNPFNTGGGSASGALGSIVFKMNGTTLSIPNSVWTDFFGTERSVSGITDFGNGGYKTISIGLKPYTGAKQYVGTTNDFNVYIDYTEFEGGTADDKEWSSGEGGANGVTINVTDDSNDQMKGTFTGTLYRFNAQLAIIDSIVITDGTFNVPKRLQP